jgi:hypothetical protein
MDKFVGELSFFYNPVEFQKMLSGSTFPALGLFSDIERFVSHTTMEVTDMIYQIQNLHQIKLERKHSQLRMLLRCFLLLNH